MKNFKRVISAVIALALSASTLVAVSASKFSDVDSKNNYAEAIEVLTALDIAHGYEEDGDVIFKPEGDITRAEAATLIVGALNMSNDAKAAAGTSKFTDVNEKASWASGYVNVGVAQGFINGMDDTTFAPQENVTYAQMCVMLTLITGYGEYAKQYGGYPTGYTTMAASAGINKGVAVSNDTPLKRGQVAQMLYNAMTAPVLGVTTYSLQGNEYAPQDGSKAEFKTILSDKFDGYAVKIKITDIPNTGAGLDKDEVGFTLTKNTYVDNDKNLVGPTAAPEPAGFASAKADIDVAGYLFMEGDAVITLDDDDDWHLVYFKPNSSVTTTVSAEDYVTGTDGGKTIAADGKVTFGSKNYNINVTALATDGIYVNGKKYAAMTDANLATVLDVAQGEVKFVDTDNTATGYEVIMATVYDVAKVASVSYTNETTTIQVTRKLNATSTVVGLSPALTTIKIADEDVAEGDVALTVKNAEGETIKLSDIKKDDIIGFAVAPGTTNTSTIDIIDIIVTDEKVTGMATREDSTEKTYIIGDEEYKMVAWGAPALTIGTSYTVALDPFGRIFEEEIEATSAKYAIAEKYDSDYGVQLILADGSAKYYEMDATTVGDAGKLFNGTLTSISPAQFETYIETTKAAAPEYRVVKYTVKNSTGKIQSIALVGGAIATVEYKAKTGKLGTKNITDNTVVINATGHIANNLDYVKFATNSFVDKTNYDAVILTADGSSNTAAFAVLTRVGEDVNAESRFAVVRKAPVGAQTADGDNCLSVAVLYEGEEQDLMFTYESDADGHVTAANALQPGDAIFFKTDSEGLVETFFKALSVTKLGVASNPTFTGAFSDFGTGTTFAGTNSKTFTFDTADWDYTIMNTAKKDYQLVYGVVTDVTSKGIELAQLIDADAVAADDETLDLISGNNSEVFGLDADCITYRYDVNDQTAAANQYKAINVGGATASTLGAYEVAALGSTTGATKTEIFNIKAGDTKGASHLTWALALIVDGDIVEIYTIAQ